MKAKTDEEKYIESIHLALHKETVNENVISLATEEVAKTCDENVWFLNPFGLMALPTKYKCWNIICSSNQKSLFHFFLFFLGCRFLGVWHF